MEECFDRLVENVGLGVTSNEINFLKFNQNEQ